MQRAGKKGHCRRLGTTLMNLTTHWQLDDSLNGATTVRLIKRCIKSEQEITFLSNTLIEQNTVVKLDLRKNTLGSFGTLPWASVTHSKGAQELANVLMYPSIIVQEFFLYAALSSLIDVVDMERGWETSELCISPMPWKQTKVLRSSTCATTASQAKEPDTSQKCCWLIQLCWH